MDRIKFMRILEGVLLLDSSNEFELLNLGYTETEVVTCTESLEFIQELSLKNEHKDLKVR